MSDPVVDIVSAQAILRNTSLEVTIDLANVPQQLTIDHSNLTANRLNYGWRVYIDVDANGVWDYQIAVSNFKFATETQRSINLSGVITGWAQVNLAVPTENRGWRYLTDAVVTASFDVANRTLYMRATNDAFNGQMRLALETYIDIGNGVTMDKVDFPP